ncbi:hypothetical protein AKS96_70 [Escherichia phage vB_EcoS_AKS96]|uniref:Uncharacterized protein n=1 Tax=Escherichia phage vB_EcoS_AKS96 TaxID=1416031 RepID=A0A067YXY8_9CAUD|nr:hypothetical protein LD31_gp70 [Escherichia phage vB_EcoS_AKS96]AHI60773.1 hypothetical protein AKS96_70 [Escherichia phage vB_EcoS_AKS96]
MKINVFNGNLLAANDSEGGDGKRAIHMGSKKQTMRRISIDEAIKIGSFVCLRVCDGELQAEQVRNGYVYTGYDEYDDERELFQPAFYLDAEFYIAGE